ncbi:hypothetical protein RMCBS344292_19065 [Rhizopus microsporus]|nr:hypothetical protein RMCBS344292_19065 [Rhizopus microsporus]
MHALLLQSVRRQKIVNQSFLKYTSCCHVKKTPEPKITSLSFWQDPLVWQRTRVNTLRCLIGCTTGDFATMWYLQMHHPTLSPAITTAASMVCCISLETVLLQRTMKVPYPAAFKTAMGMSFVSMLAMELTENVVDWHLMGGQVVLNDPKFWMAAIVSAAAGYVVPLPYNYWRLKALGKSCH